MPDPTTPNLARDRLMYLPAGGTPIEFVPEDASVLVADRAVERIDVIRPGGKVGRWVPAGSAVPPPAPPPTPPPPPPVVTPPVVVAPPALRVRKVAEADPRDEAVRIDARSGNLVRDLIADGFEDGIVIENAGDTPVLVENVRVLNTWRTAADRRFKGQGAYNEACGVVTYRGNFLRRCGWQPGRDPRERTEFRHGHYSNFNTAGLVIEDEWIDEACAAAIQSRGPVAAIRRCLITDAAVGLLMLGPGTIEDVTVYGGHHRYNPPEPADPAKGKPARPESWTGNTALSIYHPITARNFWAVGRPGQGDAPDLLPGVKAHNIGAVVGSGSYGKAEWRPPTDAAGNVIRDLLTATDCRIAGWPGPAFAGDRPHGGAGFTVTGTPVAVDLGPLRAEVMAARTTAEVAAIVARGQKLIRDAAAATF